MVRRLGSRRWQRLHQLVYGIALLALIHFFQQTKADIWVPTFVAGLFVWLMGYRLLMRWRKGAPSALALLVLAVVASALVFAGEAIGIGLYYKRVAAAGAAVDLRIRSRHDPPRLAGSGRRPLRCRSRSSSQAWRQKTDPCPGAARTAPRTCADQRSGVGDYLVVRQTDAIDHRQPVDRPRLPPRRPRRYGMVRDAATIREVPMKADEAAELMDRDKETDRFKQRAAMVIAFFAMCLAITGLGGANAAKEAFNNNILASNYFAFFQAKNIRQTVLSARGRRIRAGVAQQSRAAGRGQEGDPGQGRRLQENRRTLRVGAGHPRRQEGIARSARASTSSCATARSSRIRISIMPRRCCRSPSCWSRSRSSPVCCGWRIFGGALGLVGMLLSLNGFLLLVEVPGLS